MSVKTLKRKALRNNEYYDIQETFDDLYKKSKEKSKINDLYKILISRENILLAYRNIKKNKGSMTKGVNESNIFSIGEQNIDELIKYVEKRFENFIPNKIRQKDIPKPHGGTRTLGIPTIEDRILQQCLKQVLEPICEAKFHNHSYGFRPNRGTLHAYSRAVTLANKNKLHYVVDVDIKGFFDNVNHGKLLKQIWHIGIRDKKIISIISKMLKAEIVGKGIPEKGTPQGGILSPLLSNIVLNEFDWWISDQWETFETRYNYDKERIIGKKKRLDRTKKYNALKRASKLKEMFIVRYADDFKIFCRNHKDAEKVFIAVKKWLKERLDLDVSPEKSKVINLRRNYSNFLGFKMKVVPKGTKQVVKSRISDKAKENVKKKIVEHINKIKKKTDAKEVSKMNATILGLHNFYKQATHISSDFSEIAFSVKRTLYNKLRKVSTKVGTVSTFYKKYYKDYMHWTKMFIAKVAIFPIDGIKHSNPINFTQEICNYTEEGRLLIHKKQSAVPMEIVRYIMKNPVRNMSVEYNDNRISKYIAQKGRCWVTGEMLIPSEMESHHIIPKKLGGNDSYNNLVFVQKNVHKLIHATNINVIEKYVSTIGKYRLNLEKLNNLRIKAENNELIL